jgi:Ca2+-binding EF-hand superfamily protein
MTHAVAMGEAEAKRLLLLMDQDKDGKVSKEEFMRFMEAEFGRLDKNKDGKLDVKELTRSQVRPALGK